MNSNDIKTGVGALLMGLALTLPEAHAQLVPPVDAIDVNLVGLAVGSAPEFSGSSHNEIAVGPIVRYQFEGSQRYFLWLGPTMQINLLNDDAWRFGPMINYRGKRDSDVDDPTVARMREIDSKVEGGVFLQYNMKLSSEKFHQIVFSTDIAGSGNGTIGHVRMMYWHPFTPGVIGNIGVGMTYANDKYMRTYYGVTGSDVALYPTLGGNEYNPGGGISGVNIPFGLSIALSKQWLASVGGRYESLQSDAKDSPIVSQHGDSNQWIYGAGLSYLF